MRRLLVVVCCLLGACREEKTQEVQEKEQIPVNDVQKASWLLGNWDMETPDGVFSEAWYEADDSTYTGFGMMKNAKGDTLFSEQLKLSNRGGVLWYIPVVSNQNDGNEVLFKEITSAADSIVFENLKHDFPQRIVYHKTSDSTLYAYIEGVQDGKKRKEEFNYKKESR